MNYGKHFNTVATPQSESIPGKKQVVNNAGGYVYDITPWLRLDRWLLLGSAGNTYYTTEKELTIANANNVVDCVKEDGARVVQHIVEISEAGRAPKNDPALFALAIAISFGSPATKKLALAAWNKVARIGTHHFALLQDLKALEVKWGRSVRTAASKWYTEKDAGDLAYQMIKYRNRNGWTHKDALILSHPPSPDAAHAALYDWAVHGTVSEDMEVLSPLVAAFERAKMAITTREIVKLVTDYRLPWEALDTKWLKNKDVWAALLPNMGLTALIRNLGRLSAIELLVPLSDTAKLVMEKLSSAENLAKSRVHPMAILTALMTYQHGKGIKGGLTWTPVPQVVAELDGAFYKTFKNVEPSGQNIKLAIDISGSMGGGWGGSDVGGVPGLTPRQVAAAVALVLLNTEPNVDIVGFSHVLIPLDITPGQRIVDVMRYLGSLGYGATDASLPILDAIKKKQDIGGFISITDNETWRGSVHPSQALERYRQVLNPQARAVMMAVTATNYSMADPKDMDSLDVAGWDSAAPALVTDFIAHRI